MNNYNNKRTYQYPLSYQGNLLWPLLFLFLFPPIGLMLLLLNTCLRKGPMTYFLHYKGSEFWLLFWTVLFFPIAILLAIFNGFNIVELNDEKIDNQ